MEVAYSGGPSGLEETEMRLLREMMRLQERAGAVTDADLRQLAQNEQVPLYRLEGLRSFYPVFLEQSGRPTQVAVCRDLVCRMHGGADHCARLRTALAEYDDIEVSEVSCLGRCDNAPAAVINDVPVCGNAEAVAAMAADGAAPRPPAVVTPERWPTDPYEGPDARYATLCALLEQADSDAARDRVIDTLKAADLCGLGGAAFPTGMKWDFTRRATGDAKTVICNADESEPGTFKDRELLVGLPHLLIEAMAIAGWCIGAARGIVYIRHEYGPEAEALRRAIDEATARGALGDDCFGSAFAFSLEIFVSPGGYILGEETALLAALQDERGEPRNKPPFPTNVGLNGQPTLINNVETLAAVPAILARGAEWWDAQGRGKHQGLKYVCVSGDVVHPGVYCHAWGTPIAEVLAAAGGIREGRDLLAFSPGGASTAFLGAAALETPLDFDALQAAGSGLGTAAIVFADDTRDPVMLGLAQLRFFRNESCGKCVPCRVGSQKAVAMVEAAMAGEPAPGLGGHLAQLDATLAQTSICGLGQVALTPLMSLLRAFPEHPSVRRIAGAAP